MIEMSDITVAFGGVKPIRELTVRLDDKVVGLVGPNGAGKTTLLNVMSGFVTPISGSVKVDGQELMGIAPYRRLAYGLRRTFQTDQVADDLTLWENVLICCDQLGLARKEAQASAARAIEYCGLVAAVRVIGSELSTEQRHLAEIAKALVGNPKLVMMDEPGAGLSDAESSHLHDLITGIPDFCGAQVFLIDHDVALISATCQTTMVLDFGQLLACGPTQTVLQDPAVKRAYLGEEDSAPAHTEGGAA